MSYLFAPRDCPTVFLHRAPEGPNEDRGQCTFCGAVSYSMRPWGETYGLHLPDCSLPIWHTGYCEGGGQGHPQSRVVRGSARSSG